MKIYLKTFSDREGIIKISFPYNSLHVRLVKHGKRHVFNDKMQKEKKECICGLHFKATLHISKYLLHNFSEHYPVSQTDEIENKVSKSSHVMQLAK